MMSATCLKYCCVKKKHRVTAAVNIRIYYLVCSFFFTLWLENLHFRIALLTHHDFEIYFVVLMTVNDYELW